MFNNTVNNSNLAGIELRPLSRASSFASTSLQSDVESLTDTVVASRQLLPKNKKLVYAGIAGAVALTTGAIGLGVKFTSRPTRQQLLTEDAFSTCSITPSWCNQLENFTWVVPNNPQTHFSSFYANFHNEPQNLTQQCIDLFGKNQTVANPQPNAIQSFFGPFPLLPQMSALASDPAAKNISFFNLSSLPYPTYPIISTSNDQVMLSNQTLSYVHEMC